MPSPWFVLIIGPQQEITTVWRVHLLGLELFVPVIGGIIRAGGSFPVDRRGTDLGAVRTSLRILQGGGTLGIFPEGTRGGGEVQGGTALLALKGKAPVLPVGLRREGRRWIVEFGPPIAPAGGLGALTAEIGARLGGLAGEPIVHRRGQAGP